jgi:hypothetical protein
LATEGLYVNALRNQWALKNEWSNIMTHQNDQGHDHSHDPSHNHGHSHSQGHDHNHSHDQPRELTFEQKLEKLFGHWIEHNDSHKDTFYTWAGRAREAGLDQIAENIEKAGLLSEDVTRQLRDALNKLKG